MFRHTNALLALARLHGDRLRRVVEAVEVRDAARAFENRDVQRHTPGVQHLHLRISVGGEPRTGVARFF
ncbi:hypothetical protein [Lentzea sp. HUAS12]|uniref:hypothetical protein n=1 Tax=Lentzea sp. HUAS12 TaxID=2951806 RepID=UPI00209FD197|nr:hypothetical protein [Lentzea sp. HUAS12]USX51835.1 hypothetical protein ND450_41980 [Lentzea sp. HUAS12]